MTAIMRTAEFDREAVLRAAIDVFLVKGYSQTSMQDLKLATGLHPGSIYCAFENKQGLLLAALKQYQVDKAAEFREYFSSNDGILVGLRRYLDDTLSCTLGQGGQKACLSQKALTEMAELNDEIAQVAASNHQQWQAGFEQVFEKAQESGEISTKRSPKERAQSLVMGLYGLRTYAQTAPESRTLHQLVDRLYEDICRP